MSEKILQNQRSVRRANSLAQQLEFIFRAGPKPHGRDAALEQLAQNLLSSLGVIGLSKIVRVEWNPRMRSAAGRADFRRALISLNSQLQEHGAAEIDRTLRHELAHLLAHARAGRRRITPHGAAWRLACRDLGIGDEKTCHTLPFVTRRLQRRFLYECPKCGEKFLRVKRIRGAVACLGCCRKNNHGNFDARYRLRLVETPARTSEIGRASCRERV